MDAARLVNNFAGVRVAEHEHRRATRPGLPGQRPIWKFTSLEFIAVNGTPPGRSRRVQLRQPRGVGGLLHARSMATDRETVALGFNSSAGACADNLDEYVYVGIKCLIPVSTFYISGADHVCGYNVALTALPFELYEGVAPHRARWIRPAYANLEGELSGETFPGGADPCAASAGTDPAVGPAAARVGRVRRAAVRVAQRRATSTDSRSASDDTIQLTIERVGDARRPSRTRLRVDGRRPRRRRRSPRATPAARRPPSTSRTARSGSTTRRRAAMRNLFCGTYRERAR